MNHSSRSACSDHSRGQLLICGLLGGLSIFAVGCLGTKQQPSSSSSSDSPDLAWHWDDRQAYLPYCIQDGLRRWDVELRFGAGRHVGRPITMRISKGDEVAFVHEVHIHTTFLCRPDDVIYFADFDPISTGCVLIAYDLKAKKELWKTDLRALGGPAHSVYSNQVTVEEEDGDIVVYGDEAFGRYIERVDRATGRTLQNKRLPARNQGSASGK